MSDASPAEILDPEGLLALTNLARLELPAAAWALSV